MAVGILLSRQSHVERHEGVMMRFSSLFMKSYDLMFNGTRAKSVGPLFSAHLLGRSR